MRGSLREKSWLRSLSRAAVALGHALLDVLINFFFDPADCAGAKSDRTRELAARHFLVDRTGGLASLVQNSGASENSLRHLRTCLSGGCARNGANSGVNHSLCRFSFLLFSEPNFELVGLHDRLPLLGTQCRLPLLSWPSDREGVRFGQGFTKHAI